MSFLRRIRLRFSLSIMAISLLNSLSKSCSYLRSFSSILEGPVCIWVETILLAEMLHMDSVSLFILAYLLWIDLNDMLSTEVLSDSFEQLFACNFPNEQTIPSCLFDSLIFIGIILFFFYYPRR